MQSFKVIYATLFAFYLVRLTKPIDIVMITAIIASVTPFVAAQPVDTAATMPETPVATYNWSDQNAKPVISDGDMKNGAQGTFSLIPGGGGAQTIDDWNLA